MKDNYSRTQVSRRQFLRTAAGSAVALSALPLLAACVAPAAPAATSGSEGAAAPANEVVHLTMNMRAGGEQSEPAIYVRRPAAFIEENPNVEIELVPIPGEEYETKILTSASAGTLADVLYTADVWTHHTRLVKLGVIRPVDDDLEANGISKDEWLPAAVQTLSQEGIMYGLPKASHPGDAYLWINEDLFNAAGISLPDTYGVTFDNITEWAEALSSGPEDNRDVYGFTPSPNFIQPIVNCVRQFGSYEINEEGTESLADSEGWAAWVAWNKNFYDRKFATVEASMPSGGGDALFLAGKVAMRHNQRYFYRRVDTGMKEVETPFSWRVVQFPRGPEAKGWSASVDTHSVSSTTQHPAEAFALIHALSDATFARMVAEDQGYLTARVDDLETIKDISNPFLELQYQCMIEEERFHQPANARQREVETIYKNELDKIWLGQEELTPDFMLNMKTAIDEVLNKPF